MSSENDPQPSTSSGRGQISQSRGRGGYRGKFRPPFRSWNNANRFMAPPREKPVTLGIPQQNNLENITSLNGIQINPPENQPPITFLLDKLPDKYPVWKLYHPTEAFSEGSRTVTRIQAFEKHLKTHQNIYELNRIATTLWFPLNLQTLQDDQTFTSEWYNFKQDLQDNPENTLACASIAMHQFLLNKKLFDSTSQNLGTIKARIYGHGPILKLRTLKVNSYGKMITVRGTIIKVGAASIICSWMAFKCSTCSTQQTIRQPDGIMVQPTSCRDGCRARSNFKPILSSNFTKTETIQEIRLQESSSCNEYEGRVPRSIEIEISEDLVDSVCPGDDATITGILKVKPQDDYIRRDQANMYKMYLHGITIVNNQNSMNTRKNEYTEKDLDAIKLIKSEPNPFRLLIHSLCPSIYGHEMVKAGLILGLFGGTVAKDSVRRTETHVLVVGDPGVGKTHMLQACANVSPRGIFVCGNSSTKAGLTVTVTHEKGTGSSLEAGALVLADQGACCIDEFDKMASNQQSLLEVMEQQTVSIAKAGVLCTLPARTSILAAANPSGGHYDKSKTVSENLKIGPALLSRFDLVFIVLDRPNEYHDSLLTKHIQDMHAKQHQKSTLGPSNSKIFRGNASTSFFSKQNSSKPTVEQEDVPLYEILKLKPNENLDRLPHILMQKYISYAKKNVNPQLTPEAKDLLKKFYLELRSVQNSVDTIPVTIRQLEALIRITQARARVDLCEVATAQHANDVLSIFRQSMVDVFSTNVGGELQMQRGINGSGMSQATQVKKYLKVLQSYSMAQDKTVFSTAELKGLALDNGFQMNFLNLLETLNVQGFLLKKGMSLYKLLNE